MANQLGRVFGGTQDLARVLLDDRAILVDERQLRVAGDDRQQVVEVVSDAARQLADGIELLRLPKLLLERMLVAHVLDEPDHALRQTERVLLDGALHAHPDHLAVGVGHAGSRTSDVLPPGTRGPRRRHA